MFLISARLRECALFSILHEGLHDWISRDDALSAFFMRDSMRTGARIIIPLFSLAMVVAVGIYLSSSGGHVTPYIPDFEQPKSPADVRPHFPPALGLPSGTTGGATTSSTDSSTGQVEDASCRDRMRKLGVVSNGPCIDVGAIVDDLAVGTYLFNKPATA